MIVLATTTVASRGQVQIPSELMDRFGIAPGGPVEFVDLGPCLAIVPKNGQSEETVRRLLAELVADASDSDQAGPAEA